MGAKMEIPVGARFGHLVVIREVERIHNSRRFLCKCDCGNEKEFDLVLLTQKKAVTCGCRKWVKSQEDYNKYVGQKFGKLTVVKVIPREIQYSPQLVECKCDCGNTTVVKVTNLKIGKTKSCGCLVREMNWIDGRKFERIHSIWVGMISRCKYEKLPAYERYGGRGIKVCDEWKDYSKFREWALANGYRDDLTLDRKDTNGNYEPSNCRWADRYTQANNTRKNVRVEYKGETHTLSEWSRITGISLTRLYYRYTHGFPVDKVFYNGKLPRGGLKNG